MDLCARVTPGQRPAPRERREGRGGNAHDSCACHTGLGEHKPARAGAEENVWPAVGGVVGRPVLPLRRTLSDLLAARMQAQTRRLWAASTNTPTVACTLARQRHSAPTQPQQPTASEKAAKFSTFTMKPRAQVGSLCQSRTPVQTSPQLSLESRNSIYFGGHFLTFYEPKFHGLENRHGLHGPIRRSHAEM